MGEQAFEVSASGDVCTVHCVGRLNAEQAPRLREQVKPLVRNARRVTLDLSEVTYMDSIGLGTIASLYVSARTAGCQLEVINLSRRIRDLFSMTHLLSLFEAAGQSNARMP